jgi:hypothetical protein
VTEKLYIPLVNIRLELRAMDGLRQTGRGADTVHNQPHLLIAEKSKRRDNEADGDGRSSREKAHKERSKTKSGGEKKGKEKGDEGRREKRHRDKERERHS